LGGGGEEVSLEDGFFESKELEATPVAGGKKDQEVALGFRFTGGERGLVGSEEILPGLVGILTGEGVGAAEAVTQAVARGTGFATGAGWATGTGAVGAGSGGAAL
jgi:hypothetical protein